MKEIKKILNIYKAMSDATRLRILNLLANRGEICVCDLVKVLKISQGRISSHLKILRGADLVEDRREGLWIIYSLPQKKDSIYRNQIKCIKKQFYTISPFKDDIEKFNELKRKGVLAQCCSSSEENAK